MHPQCVHAAQHSPFSPLRATCLGGKRLVCISNSESVRHGGDNCTSFCRGLLPIYWADDDRTQVMRQVVNQLRNCEDIAMNFMAASATGVASVAVDVGGILEGNVRDSNPSHVHKTKNIAYMPDHQARPTQACAVLYVPPPHRATGISARGDDNAHCQRSLREGSARCQGTWPNGTAAYKASQTCSKGCPRL